MHCVWYPSMPCSRGCTIPAFLAAGGACSQGSAPGRVCSGEGGQLLWGEGGLLPRGHSVHPTGTYSCYKHEFYNHQPPGSSENSFIVVVKKMVSIENYLAIWKKNVLTTIWVFLKCSQFSNKKYHIWKRLFEPATFCLRNEDATRVPVKHR